MNQAERDTWREICSQRLIEAEEGTPEGNVLVETRNRARACMAGRPAARAMRRLLKQADELSRTVADLRADKRALEQKLYDLTQSMINDDPGQCPGSH